ncbi:hypothetical protein EW026_g1987 [Hermanssonia centrifuga]|uniref:Uncharacterized protein n=1 Tax=Hermanssonia centrifuga TaxID=98765 RepID=A0A4S4KPN7_9APHY|nr:hypothetical protein EW026_g1987 [Hermanssonia centrifuga]
MSKKLCALSNLRASSAYVSITKFLATAYEGSASSPTRLSTRRILSDEANVGHHTHRERYKEAPPDDLEQQNKNQLQPLPSNHSPKFYSNIIMPAKAGARSTGGAAKTTGPDAARIQSTQAKAGADTGKGTFPARAQAAAARNAGTGPASAPKAAKGGKAT